MSVVAVIGSDTHISEFTWAGRAKLRGDSFFGFQQLVDKATELKVPLVIAGDCWELLHQPRPSSTTVDFVRSQIDRLQAAGCPMYYINGQHDQLAKPFWFEAIHNWPQHVGQKLFHLGEHAWFGLDFFEVDDWESKVSLIPPTVERLVVHQQWREFSHSALIAQLELAHLPAKLVISGDWHQAMQEQSQESKYYSIGCTHMRSLSEPKTHYYGLLNDDDSITYHTLLSRPVIDLVIDSSFQFLESLAMFGDQCQMQMQNATLAGMPPEVAIPLVIVEDNVGCEPLRTLTDKFDFIFPVLKRRTASAVVTGEKIAVSESDFDPRKMLEAAAVNAQLDHATQRLVQAIVRGESLISVADAIAKEIAK